MRLFKKVIGLFSREEIKLESHVLTEQNTEVNVKESLTKQNFELTKVINDADLRPEEILMLDAKNGSGTDNDYFPGFWNYQYNVNPKELFESLIFRGFFEEKKSLEITLNNKTVDELKDILRKNQLKLSGNKSILIDRILNDSTKEDLANIELKSVYNLSVKGQEILDKNEHIIYFHRNSEFNISIYEAHDFKLKNSHYSPSDIAWHLLSQQSQDYSTKGNWGLYRNTRLNLARVALSENNLETALTLLFEVCYLDLSGLSNNFSFEYINIYEKYFFPYEESNHTIAPGIIKLLIKTKVKLKLADNELQKYLFTMLEDYNLPFHLFTKEEVVDIILAEINNDKAVVSKIYTQAAQRYVSNR